MDTGRSGIRGYTWLCRSSAATADAPTFGAPATVGRVPARIAPGPSTQVIWGGSRRRAFGRVAEKNIPDCAGFSFVFKAWQQAHSRANQLLLLHRKAHEKTSGMVCSLTEIALGPLPSRETHLEACIAPDWRGHARRGAPPYRQTDQSSFWRHDQWGELHW